MPHSHGAEPARLAYAKKKKKLAQKVGRSGSHITSDGHA